ncbi:MAG: hypothetical protein CI952_812 [Methanohalophilus sp.]|uniref:Uncharacterized protein n=1 Tax=Methanohalophilus euhalobius TaxID=51203 RepID=A0A285FZR1_9EURY|nr:MAG: hypothetical protein A8273_1627 [Methanohalophilus sp. 2-GBenrich]RSD35768.1 MAG: hypothetical protein CI952_812 [Methanohalophilus sp.]RXG33762.1 hypothetical protein CI957_1591 [Methanohalophilus sp. WG1-DM]SNY16769.1 hypothetical protein SAMN06295989_10660 [Methanohalophilus euhalobius]
MSVFYDTERRLKSSERRIENSNFSERDKNLLFSYEADLFVDGLGECQVLKYLDQLYRLRLWLDTDFELRERSKDTCRVHTEKGCICFYKEGL